MRCEHRRADGTSTWKRVDMVHPYKRTCSSCGALGYVRKGTLVRAYRCRERGCRRDAVQRGWEGSTERHYCQLHQRHQDAA